MVPAGTRPHSARSEASPTDYLGLIHQDQSSTEPVQNDLSVCGRLTFGQSPLLPEVLHKVLQILVAECCLIQLLPVEGLAETPIQT